MNQSACRKSGRLRDNASCWDPSFDIIHIMRHLVGSPELCVLGIPLQGSSLSKREVASIGDGARGSGYQVPASAADRTERVSVERSLPLVCQQWSKSRPAHHSEVFDYCRHLAQEGALFTGELGPLQ
jgi:hypothetical protein